MGAQLSADKESVNEELAAISACQNGNKEAFATLYEMYVRNIYDFLYFRTFHKETAEDLTSETFLKALRSIDRYDASRASFATWLYRIARNTLIDFVRTKKDVASESAEQDPAADPRLDAQIDADATLLEVRKILETFSEEQRDVIIMRLWDQLPYEEIAEITGKSEDACKMQFSRGLATLRKNLPSFTLLLLFIFMYRL